MNHSTPEAERSATWAAPVLAVAGWSGSGKTTLLEAAVPALVARGLRVAVLKHDAHGPDVDRPGKDSDRLFQAGADLLLQAPAEIFTRRRPYGARIDALLDELALDHDLVLLEGHRTTPFAKVWLAAPDRPLPPPGTKGILELLPWGSPRVEPFLAFLDGWLPAAWRARPLLGGILIGGRSSRMGSPKHLLPREGTTFLERTLAALSPLVSQVVVLGSGEIPAAHAGIARLADPPGLVGPLAGMLAASRWAPRAGWIFTACDQPSAGSEAYTWLAGERAPGRWAIQPGGERGRPEPLPGLYEPQSRSLLEQLARTSSSGPSALTGSDHVAHPQLPPGLAPCWRSVNRPEDLLAGPASMA